MSFEGFIQYLCPKGHYWTRDADDDCPQCPRCERDAVWKNTVSEWEGYIQLEPAGEKKCPWCNSLLEEFFHIPAKGGRRLDEKKD